MYSTDDAPVMVTLTPTDRQQICDMAPELRFFAQFKQDDRPCGPQDYQNDYPDCEILASKRRAWMNEEYDGAEHEAATEAP